jgi:hypothetical protein
MWTEELEGFKEFRYSLSLILFAHDPKKKKTPSIVSGSTLNPAVRKYSTVQQ